MAANGTARLWLDALRRRSVWRRALVVGIAAGTLQVTLHQGDVLLRDGLSFALLAKCLVSQVIGVTVALASAVWVYVEREQSKQATLLEAS